MGIQLLSAGASTIGKWADTHSIAQYRISLRIYAYGGFGGSPVILEKSPDNGTTAEQFATLLNGEEVRIESPIDMVRARTDGALTGIAKVVAEISG